MEYALERFFLLDDLSVEQDQVVLDPAKFALAGEQGRIAADGSQVQSAVMFEDFALQRDESASAAGSGCQPDGVIQRLHDPRIGQNRSRETQDAVIAGDQLVGPGDHSGEAAQVREEGAVQFQVQEIFAAHRRGKRFARESVGDCQEADATGQLGRTERR